MSTTKVKAKAPKLTIIPNGNRLFVRPLIETMSEGGIILPEGNKNREVQRGEVIEVGPGMYTADGRRITMTFKKGDVVLYPKFCGNEVQIGQDKFLIVTEPDVLGVETHR